MEIRTLGSSPGKGSSEVPFIPITPQGDGNRSKQPSTKGMLVKAFIPITPQGDGNV